MDLQNGIKCVIVGDGAVGKTCMLVSYSTNKFPTEHVPTVFDNYAVTITANAVPHTLMLFDTAGQEDYDRLRLLSYPGTDVFLVCYSIVNSSSFENIPQRWVPELKQNCPKVPFILVGNQTDLRTDEKTMAEFKSRHQEPITTQMGQRMAKKIGAVCYMECSALTQSGLKQVFDKAVITVLNPGGPKKKKKRFSCLGGEP